MKNQPISSLGVFYTCYTEKRAVEFSIALLRKIYPTVPVYLVSDGGDDFKYLQNYYPNMVCQIEYDSRGFIPQLNNENFREEINQKQIVASIYTFLDRVERAAESCGSEWLLIMEPDVIVRGPLSVPEYSSLLGSRINTGISHELRQSLAKVHGAVDVNCWGATPALFKVSAFKKAKAVLLGMSGLLRELCRLEYRLAYYDVLLAVMFALIGEVEVFNNEITECYRHPDWVDNAKPLIHQFRGMYPKESEGHMGHHIRHKNSAGLGDRRALQTESFIHHILAKYPEMDFFLNGVKAR